MRRNEGTRQTMTTDPQAPGQGGSGEASRLGVRSIKDVSHQRDDELAVIFREMRRASGITQEQIAGRLATGVNTIEALESGALAELPDWGELKRIITTYAAQLGLDSRPILRRIQGQLGVADNEVAADVPKSPPAKAQTVASEPQAPAAPPKPKRPATPTGLPMPPSARKTAQAAPVAAPPTPQNTTTPSEPPVAPAPPRTQARTGQPPVEKPEPPLEVPQQQDAAFFEEPAKPVTKGKGRFGKIVKGMLNWSLLIVLVAALGSGIWYATQNPRKVWGALDSLPDPIPGLMRGAWEMVRPLEKDRSAPAVTDPDNRRSNKLP